MNNLEAIYARLRENEEITRKFHVVESKILSILNFKDFLEGLLTSIRDTFSIPYVWITLIKNTEVQELMNNMDGSEMLKERTNIIDRDYFLNLIENELTPLLANNDLKPFYKLLPPNQKYFLKSIAIAPISLDGEIIGSLNQGDVSAERFDPQIDTSLLAQLAIKVSLCLSNVTAHEKLKYFAYHDSLTELLNRRVMEKVLKREFVRAQRYETVLSVVFMDIDRFKIINDSFGHDIGDHILKYTADILTKMTRDTDVVARFAGDEFVIILPETEAEKASFLMDRIQDSLKKNHYQKDPLKIEISISFGIASTTDKTINTPELLLKISDERLYEAKRQKKADVK
ncbi:MAG: sensor domain-containing diguanylate cyclase [Proteobacteria bacterium]|nr:sensor domain-containing diguanylate cyclase [Pseudomonadota bacterium]